MTKILKGTDSYSRGLINKFGAIWIITSGPSPMSCFGGELGYYAHPKGRPYEVRNIRKSYLG